MGLLIRILIIILLTPTIVWGACETACTKASTTYTCTDISYDCVNAAVGDATTGDTINLAAGSATWSSSIDFDAKLINLVGAGKTDSGTVITSDAASASLIKMGHAGSMIRGIKFIDARTSTSSYGLIYAEDTGWVIYDCAFISDDGAYMIPIQTNGTGTSHIQGVVAGCDIYNGSIKVFRNNTQTQAQYNTLVYNDGNFGIGGTDYSVYIEGNYFHSEETDGGQVLDTSHAIKVVSRFNTIEANNRYYYIEGHGLRNNPSRGTLLFEHYKNYFNVTVGTSAVGPFQIRGGSGVIWGNRIQWPATNRIIKFYVDRAMAATDVGICDGSHSWDGNTAIQAGQYGTSDGNGTHDGSNNAGTLSDSASTWTVDALIGITVYNVTDGSSCTITDNDEHTVTCTLSGGTDNDWDTGDTYKISNGYPCRDTIGRGIDDVLWAVGDAYAQTRLPVYAWDNLMPDNLTTIAISTPSASVAPSEKHIVSLRDYYDSATSAGVTSGTSLPETCAASSDGAYPSYGFWNTSTNRLYRCSAENTWEETPWFSPAECPHPLLKASRVGLAGNCQYVTNGAGMEYWNKGANASIGSGAAMSIGSGAVMTLQ